MQLNFHIPDQLARRFKRSVPLRKRSAFISELIERELPDKDKEEEDALYLIGLEVEKDRNLSIEMDKWEKSCVSDGIINER